MLHFCALILELEPNFAMIFECSSTDLCSVLAASRVHCRIMSDPLDDELMAKCNFFFLSKNRTYTQQQPLNFSSSAERLGKFRIVLVGVMNVNELHSRSVCVLQDECGQFAYDGLAQVHWVSFLDGRQRVLLFTEDVAVVTKARQAEELEQFQQEVNISLQNLGLSLVNNDNRHEIAYVGITR